MVTRRFFTVREYEDAWNYWPGSAQLWAKEKCFHEEYDYYVIVRSPSVSLSSVEHALFEYEKTSAVVSKDNMKIRAYKCGVNYSRLVEYKEDDAFLYYTATSSNPEKEKIFFVTLCDKEGVSKVDTLKKSLHGELLVIDTYDHSIGNFSKLTKFHEFLEHNSDQIEPDDIICFIDAFDMLCINFDKDGIIREFKKYKKDILFGAEENCGPEHPSFVKKYFDGEDQDFFERNYLPVPGCYLNGGFQIGYKRAFLDLHRYVHENFETLKSNLEIDRNTEQGILSQVFVKELFNMGLDDKRTIVNNVAPYRDIKKDQPSFFVHVIRADTHAKKFEVTEELREMYRQYTEKKIRYNKHIDMMLHQTVFAIQTDRYREIVRHFTDFDRFTMFTPRIQ